MAKLVKGKGVLLTRKEWRKVARLIEVVGGEPSGSDFKGRRDYRAWCAADDVYEDVQEILEKPSYPNLDNIAVKI
jgi:hypothetical protein